MASNRKALCVGINLFKNYPNNSLQGCGNDANAMEALLKGYLGFMDTDIVKLIDAQATKANIMSNLKEMVDGAKAGRYSYLVFSLSSHGTQVPDINGDEPDRADEAFCPHDLSETNGQWDPDHIITDDELHDLFAQLPPNVILEAFLDTCHSGTGLRAIDFLLDRKPRFMPPPSLEAFKAVEGRRSRGLRGMLLEKGIVHQILWAACRDDQTSADACIDGSWHGAFSYYFCKVVNETQNKVPRNEILAQARAGIATKHYNQIPQLECEGTAKNKIMGEL